MGLKKVVRNWDISFSDVRRNKRMMLTAMHGRGRKRAKWVSDLDVDLREEFDILPVVGVKMNTLVLFSSCTQISRLR